MHRSAILTLLVLTGLLGACLDAEEADQIEQRIVAAEAPVVDPRELRRERALEEASSALRADMERAMANVSGRRGAAVKEIGRGDVIVAGSHEPMAQQSVSKLWVNLTVAEMVARGRMTYQDPVIVTDADRAVFHQPLARRTSQGSVRTSVGELMTMAITRSDNMANQVLLDLVGGPAAVQSWLIRNDVPISFGPGDRIMQPAISGLSWHPSYGDRSAFERARNAIPAQTREKTFSAYAASPVDGAGVIEMAEALERMQTGAFPGSRDIVALMADTTTGRSRLKAGTPPGWSLKHKTGTGQTWRGRRAGFNDVGLMTSPEGRTYAVAVMIGESSSPDRVMQQAIADIAVAVAAFHRRTQECCARQM